MLRPIDPSQRSQLRHLGRAQRRRTARAAMRLQAVDPAALHFRSSGSKMASAAGRSIARLPFAESMLLFMAQEAVEFAVRSAVPCVVAMLASSSFRP